VKVTKRRFPRKDITGAPGWEVNAAGIVYRSRHIQPITNCLAGLPSVDLGREYTGPIPSAGLFPRGAKVSKELCPTHRLLEEIVAYEFLGRPAHWGKRVAHLDGDDWNCAADNLRWISLPRFDEDAELMRSIMLMRRDDRSGRGARKKMIPTKPVQRLHFVTALNVPGRNPVPSKG
jgi:hypothetical protein